MNEKIGIKGKIKAELFDVDGNLKQISWSDNIVTVQGNSYYVDQLGDGNGSAAQLIFLGTGTGVTPGTTDTWVAGPFSDNGTITTVGTAGSVTTSTHASTANILQYVGTFGAGYATQTGITEAGLTNRNPEADGNGTTNGTSTFFIAHGTLNPSVNKGASDTLVITWLHTLAGA